MSKFTPDEKVIKIMKNFADINPSMLIEPTKLAVINTAKSVIAKYPFTHSYTFEPFGLYDTNDILGIINAISNPEIEVKDKYINIIGSNDDKVKYFTTASDLVPKVPDLEPKMTKISWELDFSITADKLAIILKMANILKAKFLFFETDSKQIRITVGDELESSGNNYEVHITDNINVNQVDNVIKIPIINFKVLPGEYDILISKRITKWSNLNGVTYYISTAD